MMLSPAITCVLTILLAASPAVAEPQTNEASREALEKEQARIKKWEPQIKAFEEQDVNSPPRQKAALFVGSSSIRLWKLKESFPDIKTLNRGFGGSQLADSVHYADRIVTAHKPRVVVLYAGDNDLAGGKSPAQVAADFTAFIKKVRSAVPEVKIVYLGIKPSIARWKLIEKVRQANRLIRSVAEEHDRVVFVDVEPPMLGADGLPRKELFAKDGLHLSPAGYEVWASLVTPHIKPGS